MKRLSFLFVAISLVGCAKKPAPPPTAYVDPGGVETILLAESGAAADQCAAALERQGAKVLYRSASGALFTNRKAAELSPAPCRATVVSNEKLTLSRAAPTTVGAPTADLPTLLKLIPAETIGARTFVQNNPTYDGRGVIVAVLDTGVEIDHPMLRKNPDGEDKIVASYDFSGQGRVETTAVTVTNGELTAGGATYKVGTLPASAVRFGTFAGSSLVYSEDVAASDTFKDVGVITFEAPDGTWHGKIDTDDDKDFSDEAELYDFGKSRAFTKLGDNRTLTANLNISDDGAIASVVFDDGSHGTHVAGIATGYDPGGLRGVAPGAKVIAAKIGDNRLSGGSTTTASMMLAIDFAAANGAQVINMSYGIRTGSNVGKSAIAQYVDRVAREKGILFSISAGNEGPGTLTIGTPSEAELALSPGAYLPKDSAHSNYGYTSITKDTLWYFSSIGPQLDGGWKPTILAPGTALSSIPGWGEGHATYSGTSMAAPQVAGGLALVLSAALQERLPLDRATVTRAVYLSARPVADLKLIEQGHGLMTVPGAYEALKKLKGSKAVEYTLSVNSPTAPGGKGRGIFVRSRKMPENAFSVAVTPVFPAGTVAAERNALKTYRLESSAAWIRTPADFHLLGSARAFRVDLDASVFATPGLYSEKITAVDEASGLTAFEVPVTVVVPHTLSDANNHEITIDAKVDVGTVHRFFVDVPAGTTALQWDLISDGPSVWAQLLDSEGREMSKLQDPDRNSPQAPLLGQANLTRAGVYEIDVVAPPFINRAVGVKVRLKAYSLLVTQGAAVSATGYELLVENAFGAVKVAPKVEVASVAKTQTVVVKGNSVEIPFEVTEKDISTFSALEFRVRTAKSIYDKMTDFPYMLLDDSGNLVTAGGLELDSKITISALEKHPEGKSVLRVTGAFTESAPETWVFELSEERTLRKAIAVHNGANALVETGQQLVVPVDLARAQTAIATGFRNCATLKLMGAGSRLIQSRSLCP